MALAPRDRRLPERQLSSNRSNRSSRGSAGFTLVEVLVAVLLAMVGLLGTIAIQQTMMNANAQASDTAIATRLATQRLEEFNARITRAQDPPNSNQPAVDHFDTPDRIWTDPPGAWSDPAENVDPQGNTNLTPSPRFRFERRWMVVKPAAAGAPYQISVQISWRQGERLKTVRLDVERQKTW